MLRLAEKRAKRFRNVTRNFACLLLVSRTSQENVFYFNFNMQVD